jgi:hypothetical protein
MRRGAFTVWFTPRTGVKWFWAATTLELPAPRTDESAGIPSKKNAQPEKAQSAAERPAQTRPLSPRVVSEALNWSNPERDRELRASAKQEARSLFTMVGKGAATVRSIRELIGIDPQQERKVFASMTGDTGATASVRQALLHRVMVLEEFDRLAKRPEHAERIAAAEAKASTRATPAPPIEPVLQVRVVPLDNRF